MTTQDQGHLLDQHEVAELLGVHPATLQRQVRAGRFPRPIKIGRQIIRWRRVTIERFLAEAEAAGSAS